MIVANHVAEIDLPHGILELREIASDGREEAVGPIMRFPLAVLLTCAFVSPLVAGPKKVPIILDTDIGADIDDAMLVNFYGPDQQQPKATARRQTRPTDLVGMKSLTERLDVVVEPGFV